MNCVIVEDEINSRILLQEILARYFPELKLQGVASSVDESVQLIDTLKPDLILMDVEITGGTGFDVLDKLTYRQGRVIFITGYEHYAVKAIKYAALDYLVKPISIQELGEALKRIQDPKTSEASLEVLKNNSASDSEPRQLMVPQGRGFNVVAVSDIDFLEAHGQYVYLHLKDKKRLLASYSLGHYEDMLDQKRFFRTHKSFIVNLERIVRVVTRPALQVELRDGTFIDLAVRRKENFMELFDRLKRD
jgi:two-component system LytT family response regulator